MQVNDELVDKLSRLSMLHFNDEEKEVIKSDLQKMIGFIDKLQELDTSGIEPMLHMGANKNVYREDDTPGNMVSREEALKNAAHHDGTFFKLPRVILK